MISRVTTGIAPHAPSRKSLGSELFRDTKFVSRGRWFGLGGLRGQPTMVRCTPIVLETIARKENFLDLLED